MRGIGRFLVFLLGLTFCLGVTVLADTPQNSMTLTIQGDDPFNTPATLTMSSTSGSSSATGITTQSVVGASSVGGAGQTSTSQLGSILGLSQNYFQTGDINLSQGGMQQSEIDLKLPGRNGLDFSVMRSYSSLKYRSEPNLNPADQKQWGPYAGRGWGFNFGMRVYVIRSNDSNSVDKVFVESMDGIDEYEGSLSKQPGNFNKTKVITSGGKMDPITEVQFITTDGKVFAFSKKFFTESYTKTVSGQTYSYRFDAYYLTQIRDVAGNAITFSYQDLAAETSVSEQLLGAYVGKGNIDYIGKNGYVSTGQTRYTKTRVSSAVDTFGRQITMYYGESSNLNTTNPDQVVSSIGYTGIDGTQQKIVYSYDANGCLTRVQVGNLPAKTYEYTYFQPRFDYLSIGWREGLLNDWHTDHYETDYGRNRPYEFHTKEPPQYAFLKGYLLNKITAPLGAVTSYHYEDCLVTTPNGINTEPVFGATLPVVIQKQITADGITKTYSFNYPRDTGGYLSKSGKYRPPKQDTDAYYFKTVTIDNPSEMLDESYVFEKGMVIKRTQGIMETQTYWDYEKLLKGKEISLKNGIIQSQVEYQYGSYYNPVSVITKKGPGLTPVLKQETTYATTSKSGVANDLIDKNLIRVVELSKTTDLTTNKVRSSFVVSSPFGTPREIYQGQNTSGVLQKKIGYTSRGELSEESVPLSNGSFLSTIISYSIGATYSVNKSVGAKNTYEEYELRTGQLIKTTDVNGNSTTYRYDSYGRPIGATYPDGSQDSVAYSADLKTTTTTSGGITSVQTIDSLARPILSQTTGQEDVKTDYYFANLPAKVYIKHNGVWVLKSTTVYDSYLRKVQCMSPDFGTSTVAYDTPAMNKITVTDPLGRQSIQTMDEFGQTTQTQDASGGIAQMTYNGFGEVTQTIDPRGLLYKAETDDYGKIIKSYFTKNQTSGAAFSVKSQPVYNTVVPSIMDSLQVFSKTGALYRTYGYQYDNEGRVIKMLLNNQIQQSITYEESNHTNSKGKATTIETPDAKTQYDFDAMGHITKETTTAKQLNKTWDIQYQYNTNGQLVSMRYPDGKLVEYVYNSNQQLSQMKYNNQTILTYAYNSNGTVGSITYGNGKTVAYSYEKDILLSGINYNNGQYNQTYTFDSVGKTTQTQHNDYINGINPLTRSYTYTIKDELKTVKFNNVLQYTHDFDANSNLTRFETKNNRNLPANNMVVDTDSDQLIRKTHADGKYIDVTYDPEGNVSKKTYMWSSSDMDRTLGYGYNYQGQLQTVSENGQILAQYGYDHKRQRIYSKTNGVPYPEKYYYWNQSGQVVGEGITGQYGTEYSVRYFYSGNEKIAMERRDILTGDTRLYYFVNNAQGTPILIVDSTNNDAVSRINLDEYGNIGSMIGAKEEINFTGKKMDLKTGLYYFNQRYYDPELGRFLQEDPAAQGPS